MSAGVGYGLKRCTKGRAAHRGGLLFADIKTLISRWIEFNPTVWHMLLLGPTDTNGDLSPGISRPLKIGECMLSAAQIEVRHAPKDDVATARAEEFLEHGPQFAPQGGAGKHVANDDRADHDLGTPFPEQTRVVRIGQFDQY